MNFRLRHGFTSLLTVVGVSCQPIELPVDLTSTAPLGGTALPTTSLSPTVSFEHWRETAEAAAMQTQFAVIETITVSPPPTGRPPTRTPAPFAIGIFEVSYGPGVPQVYAMSTLWKGIVNGQRTLVYAGARVDTSGPTPDTSQGLVVVQVYSTDLTNKSTVEYEAPGATGILTITVAIDYRLTLMAENGSTLYFDVPSRQFVDGLTATVTAPTATPLPPANPTPVLPTGYPPPSGGYPQSSVTAPPVQTQEAP